MHEAASQSPFLIFESPLDFDLIPEGFNAVTIDLEAGQKSALNWNEALKKGDKAISKGYKLFWDLQLGLFDELSHPLSNQAQFKCLSLSINHFNTTVWEKYQNHTIGVCLYRGEADFSNRFNWGPKETENFASWSEKNSNNEKLRRQFCQQAAIDFVKLLAEQLPNEAEPFALLSITNNFSLLEEAQLRDSALTSPLRLALQGGRIPLSHDLAWKQGQSASGCISNTPLLLPSQEISLAVCMPEKINDCIASILEKLFQTLSDQGTLYRLIAEDRLTVEWDGLDDIIVITDAVTPAGKRMLQGFCAAGGRVIHVGEPIGLGLEKPFQG